MERHSPGISSQEQVGAWLELLCCGLKRATNLFLAWTALVKKKKKNCHCNQESPLGSRVVSFFLELTLSVPKKRDELMQQRQTQKNDLKTRHHKRLKMTDLN